MQASLWLALLAGVGIAAAAGLRAFLPLFVLGLAARAGLVDLHRSSEWLASDVALVALGVATVLEIAGDKIPIVDHALDLVATVIRPLAAWFGAYAMLVAWPAPWGQIAAAVLAVGALGLHAFKAQLRLGSTALTAGTANPFVSIVEDLTSLALVAAAVLYVPVLALLLVALAAWALRRRGRRRPA